MPYIPSACDITILYPVVIATTDTHRTLENERKDKLILLETVLQSSSVSQPSNVDHTSDGIATEGCGEIDTTIDYHWCDKHYRVQNLKNDTRVVA